VCVGVRVCFHCECGVIGHGYMYCGTFGACVCVCV